MIDIADAKNGLSCDCTCQGCGEPLIAKQGDVRDWYFSHKSGAICVGGMESALHKAAKQIIQLEQRLRVDSYDPIDSLEPNLYNLLHSTDYYLNGKKPNYKRYSNHSVLYQYADKELVDRVLASQKNCSKQLITVTNVQSEMKAKNSSLIPDLTCTFDGKTLYIEILVTHECDADKIYQLKSQKIPTIEIDLSFLRNKNFSLNDVREALIGKGTFQGTSIPKKWIVYPRYIAEADFYAQKLVDGIKEFINKIATERAQKAAKLAAQKSKIKAFGTTILFNDLDFGLTIWAPQDNQEILNKLNQILISLGAKRRQSDWIIKIPDAINTVIKEIRNKEREDLEVANLALTNEEIAKENQKRKFKKKQYEEIEKAILEESKHRAAWQAQEKLDAEQREKHRKERLISERLEQERREKFEADRKEFTKVTCEKFSYIVDHRWKLRRINEELVANGYPEIGVVV